MLLVYFLILISVVVFIHELGHFMAAKAFNVKVERFSIGFGPRLFGFRRGETEYRFSLLPFGGYVKMLGDEPDAILSPEERKRSFYGQAPHRLWVITFAGPAMSILFPVLVFFLVHATNPMVLPARIGMVLQGDPADRAGIRDGDIVMAVDGEPVASFEDLQARVEPNPGKPLRITVEREGRRIDVVAAPKQEVLHDPIEGDRTVGRIGVVTGELEPIIGVAGRDSPAAEAGLRTFDRILSVDDAPVATYRELTRAIEKQAGRPVRLAYLRAMPKSLVPPFRSVYGPLVIESTLQPRLEQGRMATGLEPSSLYVAYAAPQGPAARIGIQPGDRLVSIDGAAIRIWSELLAKLSADPTKPHTLVWEHEGRTVTSTSYAPAPFDPSQGFTLGSELYEPGMRAYAAFRPAALVIPPGRWSRAGRLAVRDTWDITRLTVLGVARLIQGRVSIKTLGGPIMIGDLAGAAGSQGAGTFLWLLALISINIGLINLFPIPALDGGHMLLAAIESARRKPISLRVREILQTTGVVLLLSLMALATKNDLERYWPRIVQWFMNLLG